MIKYTIKKIVNFYKNKNNTRKSYLVKKILGKNKIRLLDIGAAGGIEGIQDLWLPHLGEIELSLCEPHEESFKKIKKQNFKIIDKAFGVEQKKNNTFYETRKAECSSMKELNLDYLKKFPDPERFETIKKSQIETTTLDNEFTSNNFPHFIKIDTEGAELEILNGGNKTLENVMGLLIEVYFKDLHKNQVKFEEINNFLSQKKFEFIDFLRLLKWERHNQRHHGQIQVADALFLLPPEEIIFRFKEKKISIDDLKIYTSILTIYDRSDYLSVIQENLDKKTQSDLSLQESYDFCEKKVKKKHFVTQIYNFILKNLI